MARIQEGLRSRTARTIFFVLALAGAAAALIAERQHAGIALSRIHGADMAAAMAFSLLNLLCAAASWRAVLLEMGSRASTRSAARIYFVGQIGKYLPGGIWSFVATAELGREIGLARRYTIASFIIALLLGLATGALLALLLLPLAGSGIFARYWWVSLAAPAAVAVLHPAVLRRLLALAGIETERALSARGALVASAWAAAGWLAAGVQVWLLAASVGTPLTLPVLAVAIGGYALAWVAGFLVMVAPAGLGPREAVLVLVLTTIMAPGEALIVALLSRLLVTLADVVAAGVALAVSRRMAPS